MQELFLTLVNIQRMQRKSLYITGVYADAMRCARWREISAFSEQEGNPGTFGAKSPEKSPEVRSRGVRAGVGWRTSKIPPIEAERFSSGLANLHDPPGERETVAPGARRGDGQDSLRRNHATPTDAEKQGTRHVLNGRSVRHG